ncbi:MAG TPA: hypothetical protein VM345_15615 [Acidimicrobiales bacterium]|nr:hypothetical protein [Acidimicrobiales bacterium]
MTRRRLLPRAIAVGVAAVAVAAARPAPPPAAAAGPAHAASANENRAVVVVNTGEGEPKTACVVFSEPSITGLDALRSAQMDPVVQTYSGQGGAVCKLCGVGCNAGSSCLTCQSPKYWQYWRSVGGTGSWSYSNAGAGSVEVRDGDVEGWNWSGTRSAPPYYSIDAVCNDPSRTYVHKASAPPPPPPSTTTPQAPSTTTAAPAQSSPTPAPGAPRPSPAGTVPAGPAATVGRVGPDDPAGAPVTTLPDDSAKPMPSDGSVAADAGVGDDLAATSGGSDGDAETAAAVDRSGGPTAQGSSPAAYALFLAVLLGIIGWTIRVRVVRGRSSTS